MRRLPSPFHPAASQQRTHLNAGGGASSSVDSSSSLSCSAAQSMDTGPTIVAIGASHRQVRSAAAASTHSVRFRQPSHCGVLHGVGRGGREGGEGKELALGEAEDGCRQACTDARLGRLRALGGTCRTGMQALQSGIP